MNPHARIICSLPPEGASFATEASFGTARQEA